MIWDPSDANPLHRRLPAEIVSRRSRVETKKGPTLPKEIVEDVVVDQRTAITLKPDARPKWLGKACKMTQDGKASATELYNIVVSRRFSAGLPERIGRKLGAIVQKNLNLFSDKQKRHLGSSEFHLNYLMAEAEKDDIDEDDADAPDAPASTSARTEVMMANSFAFAREQSDTVETKQREADEKEADRMTRLVEEAREEAAKKSRREAAKREERKNLLVDEGEKMSRHKAEQEAAQKKKLEEEADALFERALCPVPATRDASHRRNRSRSRSVSAKRMESPPRRRGEWKRHDPGALTGSRAILLNRDFQEDLPHLPRSNLTGTRGVGSGGDRASRSRSRSRRRRRK